MIARRVLGLVLLGLVSLGPLLPAGAAAQAAVPPLRLRYERAPSAEACEPAEAFAARLARQLGRPPFAEEAEAELRIELWHEEEAAGGAWAARLRIEAAGRPIGGARDLRMAAESCEPLLEGLALIVALLVEPGWSGPPDPEPEPDPAPEAEPASGPPPSSLLGIPRSSPEASEPPEPSEPSGATGPIADDVSENPPGGSGLGWGLHAFAAFLAGWLPEPAFGGGLRLALWPDPIWSIELSVAAYGAEPLASFAGTIDFVGVRAGVDLCARPLIFEVLRLGGCAGIHSGGLYASPSLASGAGQDALSPHLDLAASVHLALLPMLEALPGLELRLSAGAAAVLLRGAFTVDTPPFGALTVHEVEPVLATVTLGAALRL